MNTDAINHDPAITFIQTGHPAAGPAEHGRVAQLRPRQREPEPAGVRGAALAGPGAHGRPAAVLAALGQRLPARRATRASGSAPAATRCSTSTIRRASTTATRRRDARRRRPAEHAEVARRSATRRSRRASPSTRWPIRMQTSVPELIDLSKEPESTSSTCTAPTSRKPGTLRRQLPAGAPAGRARRALRPALSPRLGPARQPAARHPRCSARTSTSRPPR